LWYLDGVEDVMSADALTLLRHTAQARGLLVSDMSVWEIGTKAAKGKLTLAPSVEGWLARAEAQAGFAFQPLDSMALLASTQLPDPIHGDPVDRILIAHAVAARIPLITADVSIMDHAEQTKSLSVCDARP
jgi:PIN domain nuclease of toxin-antitoxin system